MRKGTIGNTSRSKWMTYEQIKYLKPVEFKRLCGVQPETFVRMVEIVNQRHRWQKPGTGRPSKLTVEDQVLMTLEYLREYRTYFHIAQSWGVNESTAYRIIRKVEDYLIASEVFSLPAKKKLLESDQEIQVVVVDVTESQIERPQKTETVLQWQKKRHTFKSQIFINQANQQIICTAHAKGKKHDFTLFKCSNTHLLSEIVCLADKGYQGIARIHPNSHTPKKRPRRGSLTVEERHLNQQLAKLRVIVEHINRRLKILRFCPSVIEIAASVLVYVLT